MIYAGSLNTPSCARKCPAVPSAGTCLPLPVPLLWACAQLEAIDIVVLAKTGVVSIPLHELSSSRQLGFPLPSVFHTLLAVAAIGAATIPATFTALRDQVLSSVPHAGNPDTNFRTCPLVPFASLDNMFVAEAYKISPVVYVVIFVPPFSIGIVPKFPL